MPRRMLVLSRRSLCLLGVALAAPLPARATARTAIVLQPLGKALAREEIASVERALGAFYAAPLRVRDLAPLPAAAYYAPRRRYRAEKLLEALEATLLPDARVVIGLTTSDISTTKPPHEDWGVLGLATLDGRTAVLSSFRCRRKAKSAAHSRERFAKTAVHEVGHAFGLEHCPVGGCLMHDAEGSVLTTDGETDLCKACRKALARVGALREGARSPFL